MFLCVCLYVCAGGERWEEGGSLREDTEPKAASPS